TEKTGINRDRGVLSGNGATLEVLTRVLSMMLARPVIDRTGLDGEYKFRMEWAEEANLKEKVPGESPTVETAAADDTKPSFFSAIQEQLGLKLESSKAPVDIIVIERAEKPTAN